VEIKGIAREPGARAKVAVFTSDEAIDPIGACIGQRGSRINTIITELGGEKIDVIQYNEDAATYLKHALSPAKVESVELNDETKEAVVNVPADQYSLAIGRGGVNVRLAANLTGWTIKVVEKGGEEKAVSSEDTEVTEKTENTDTENTEEKESTDPSAPSAEAEVAQDKEGKSEE